jgi:hypothetical protein
MESQIVIVNGKPRRSHKKFGKDYVRCFYDVELEEIDYFRKKCDYLGKTDSAMIRDLILEFNRSFGWPNDDNVKNAGSLYERRSRHHIQDAIKKTVKKEFPWIFSEN